MYPSHSRALATLAMLAALSATDPKPVASDNPFKRRSPGASKRRAKDKAAAKSRKQNRR